MTLGRREDAIGRLVPAREPDTTYNASSRPRSHYLRFPFSAVRLVHQPPVAISNNTLCCQEDRKRGGGLKGSNCLPYFLPKVIVRNGLQWFASRCGGW